MAAATTSTARASLHLVSRQHLRHILRASAPALRYQSSSSSSSSGHTYATTSTPPPPSSSTSPPSGNPNSASSSAAASSSNVATPPGSSPIRDSLIKGVAKVMGYNTRTATAIRTTSDYYDRCSERDEREGSFFYEGEPRFPPRSFSGGGTLLDRGLSDPFTLRRYDRKATDLGSVFPFPFCYYAP